MEQKTLDQINFKEFIKDAAERFPEGSLAVLKGLKSKLEEDGKENSLNMDEISIIAKINRSSIATAIAPLEVLGLVDLTRYGQAKRYSITNLGLEVFEFLS
jgi:hypothetical protein